jgi:uncharacterized protein
MPPEALMPFGRIFALLLMLTLVMLGTSAYVHRHVARAFALEPRRARSNAVVTVVLASMAALVLTRKLGLRFLGEVTLTLMLAVMVSAVLLLLVDLGWLVAWLLGRVLRVGERAPIVAPSIVAPSIVGPPGAAPAPSRSPEATESAKAVVRASVEAIVASPSPSPSPSPSRRDFLRQAATGSAILLGTGSSIYGTLRGRHDYETRELVVPLPGMGKAFDGYTLVQISDIHLGLFVGEPEMRAAEDRVRAARPDRIVITGDMIDSDARYAPDLGRLVRRLAPLARDGVVAISGNHDWYTGIDAVASALSAAGAHFLRNEGLVIGDARHGFALLGVEDVWARRPPWNAGPSLDRALSFVPPDLPKVLLCHNPTFFPDAAGKVALQLSGHTHGGQFNLLVRPADLVLPYGYVAGLYERGGSKLYVNRGFGTAGPPARVGAPPELTRVVLVAG